ncbi:15418_t:CDS:2 [Entrophospora sp. SA101]|nr:15418_t:CDS:2 [Entrophospora sp. SA101]CAJ0902143.1 4489_t:CDS:2 [Entrophospora sp. SA101]CAJ0917044.1 7171_t:CDS:2 [Entrophospora sp. SA101]CAJ0917063.1 7178_t:CDS:2 [Entrophospora sp. SA101]
MLPSLAILERIGKEIMSIPNRQKESKRGVHYGLFLLGYKSGLRISEAVRFDLATKTKHGLYRITKPKGKKERFVYVPKKIIRELRKKLDDDIGNILTGKIWLESKEKEPPRPPSENFPKRPSVNSEPIIKNKPVIPTKKPIQHNNPPLLTEINKKPAITNYQPQLEQLKQTQAENSNLKLLVQSNKQNNQLLKETNTNLTHKIQADEQNHTNLINAYQKALNDKARAELFAEKENQRANHYQQQLKTIAKAFSQ